MLINDSLIKNFKIEITVCYDASEKILTLLKTLPLEGYGEYMKYIMIAPHISHWVTPTPRTMFKELPDDDFTDSTVRLEFKCAKKELPSTTRAINKIKSKYPISIDVVPLLELSDLRKA